MALDTSGAQAGSTSQHEPGEQPVQAPIEDPNEDKMGAGHLQPASSQPRQAELTHLRDTAPEAHAETDHNDGSNGAPLDDVDKLLQAASFPMLLYSSLIACIHRCCRLLSACTHIQMYP